MHCVHRMVIVSVALAMLAAAPLPAAGSERDESFSEQELAQWRSLGHAEYEEDWS